MSDLTLALNGEYFDAIRFGRKVEEYRLVTPYWVKRLEGRTYDRIVLTRGYPRADDAERLALEDPTAEWRVYFYAPLYEAVYQRQGEGRWVLVEKGEGFA